MPIPAEYALTRLGSQILLLDLELIKHFVNRRPTENVQPYNYVPLKAMSKTDVEVIVRLLKDNSWVVAPYTVLLTRQVCVKVLHPDFSWYEPIEDSVNQSGNAVNLTLATAS